MKIVDARRTDYYDGVARQFFDPSVVYIRTETLYDDVVKDSPTRCIEINDTSRGGICDIRLMYVGFCGVVHPVALVAYHSPAPKNVAYYGTLPQRIHNIVYRDDSIFPRGREWATGGEKHYKHLFDKAPIWSVVRNHYCAAPVVTLNPMLKDFGFASCVPPYQAYQELYRWLTNQARPMKPIPAISDEMKVATHGFNKFSFRKDKSAKKGVKE